ncbi:hypothetical protein M878_18030 [Streptomyces roseochromogenus subsp. oscitans DS 12.976]|uniref:DUF5753 domain-containing protein n=1 Tax=Streptomyces roseochromogenus subsp. oscitans DS 12.976 TaxID=1352936 RepID=V6KGN7_STRRC|nr:Scr1 family TA system antitoxin-like transcriptional regulator [Streptomyces roseochromogenus]EST30616.1 hypothetical protein M878_18030 [Streptomyces roseochromogenus subsp. oscitans DS 12.976]
MTTNWYPQVEHPDWFKRRAEMDERALGLREYQERVVPGLLQGPGYAQALFSQVARDESCLRNGVGSPEVMREQCAHLLSVGQRPNIRIQVGRTSRQLASPPL